MEKNEGKEEKQELDLEEDAYWKSLKKIRLITLLVIGVLGLALSVNVGVHATSTSTFCSSCHMMAPQALTWEVSSHSSIECKDCHIAPGIRNKVDAKVDGLWELYHAITDTYVAPIRMPSHIPNESCEKCHNMDNRIVSASGDIIIDHDIHNEKEISCVTCHDGVAHGKVSDRRVAYKTDFDRWNSQVAEHIMDDTKYTRPQMDKCMDCHELREAPLTCETCHSTQMLPEDHKEASFVKGEHGNVASEDLLYCESCHSYMSDKPIKEFQERAHYEKYINSSEAEKQLTVQQYAKKNTFCIDCHSQRPESHESTLFFKDHGKNIEEADANCFTCHENMRAFESPVTNVSCASCHPSSHNDNNWRIKHPEPLPPEPKFDKTCLNCHVERTCTKCHVDGNSNRDEEVE